MRGSKQKHLVFGVLCANCNVHRVHSTKRKNILQYAICVLCFVCCCLCRCNFAVWEEIGLQILPHTPCVSNEHPTLCIDTPLSVHTPRVHNAHAHPAYVHPMCAPSSSTPTPPIQSTPISPSLPPHILTSTSSSSHTSNHFQAISQTPSPPNPIKPHIIHAIFPVS